MARHERFFQDSSFLNILLNRCGSVQLANAAETGYSLVLKVKILICHKFAFHTLSIVIGQTKDWLYKIDCFKKHSLLWIPKGDTYTVFRPARFLGCYFWPASMVVFQTLKPQGSEAAEKHKKHLHQDRLGTVCPKNSLTFEVKRECCMFEFKFFSSLVPSEPK